MLVKKLRLASWTWAAVTGTTPPRRPAPTKPAGGVRPRTTYWKPDAGGLFVHVDGTMSVAPRPAGAKTCGVIPAGAGVPAAGLRVVVEECDDPTTKAATPAAASTTATPT